MTNTLRRTQNLNLWFQPRVLKSVTADQERLDMRSGCHAAKTLPVGVRAWYQERLMLKCSQEDSRSIHATKMAKKCTKRCAARANLFVCFFGWLYVLIFLRNTHFYFRIAVFTLETDYPSETGYPLDNLRQKDKLIQKWNGVNFGWTIRLTCPPVNFDGFWR